MVTREEALAFGMSFPNVYEDRPFRDQSWQVAGLKEVRRFFCGFMNETDTCN